MDAKDLRIGNYIELDDEGYSEVIKIGIDYVDVKYPDGEIIKNKETEFEEYNAIPLTEEWLLKFGFELDENAIDDFNNRHYDYGDYTVFYEEGIFIFQTENMSLNNPKYVHQLQNLYFALTEEELTIKE